MEKRIKIIYILTSVALMLLFVVQGLWLYSQYKQNIKQRAKEIVNITQQVVAQERKIREVQKKQQGEKDVSIIGMHSANLDYKKGVSASTNTIELKFSDTTYIFNIDNNIQQNISFDASMLFILDHAIPFDTATIDSLFLIENINVKSVKTKHDSIVWNVSSRIDGSILSVEVPYDNFDGECVQIIYKIPFSNIVTRMGSMLILSLLLSSLIIYSFVYQICTIHRQRKIDEVRRDFVHTMIHELKRPISTFKIFVSSLRNEKLMQNQEFKAEVLQNTYNELDNLTAYFSKLRDITMADNVDIPLNISDVELTTLINEAIAKTPIPTNKSVSIKILNQESFNISADKMHLQNIFYNLFENALKYSKNEVTITVNYFTLGEMLNIEVADKGNGIPQNELPHVFDKFFRGKDASATGMGLGLSYVKMLVEAHKGAISAESKINIGTKFTIKLPL